MGMNVVRRVMGDHGSIEREVERWNGQVVQPLERSDLTMGLTEDKLKGRDFSSH
jgi:hypothetical protein